MPRGKDISMGLRVSIVDAHLSGKGARKKKSKHFVQQSNSSMSYSEKLLFGSGKDLRHVTNLPRTGHHSKFTPRSDPKELKSHIWSQTDSYWACWTLKSSLVWFVWYGGQQKDYFMSKKNKKTWLRFTKDHSSLEQCPMERWDLGLGLAWMLSDKFGENTSHPLSSTTEEEWWFGVVLQSQDRGTLKSQHQPLCIPEYSQLR